MELMRLFAEGRHTGGDAVALHQPGALVLVRQEITALQQQRHPNRITGAEV